MKIKSTSRFEPLDPMQRPYEEGWQVPKQEGVDRELSFISTQDLVERGRDLHGKTGIYRSTCTDDIRPTTRLGRTARAAVMGALAGAALATPVWLPILLNRDMWVAETLPLVVGLSSGWSGTTFTLRPRN